MMPSAAEVLVALALGAGALAAVIGMATLEAAHHDGPFIKVRHRALPWPVRREAYTWYAVAAGCWLPVLVAWFWH